MTTKQLNFWKSKGLVTAEELAIAHSLAQELEQYEYIVLEPVATNNNDGYIIYKTDTIDLDDEESLLVLFDEINFVY